MLFLVVVIVFIMIIFCFSFVLLFGAPFLPTLKLQINEALNLLDLQTGQTLIDLGCGDGRVLIAAAQSGLKSVGYELNPLLALISWLRTRRYASQVEIIWGDYWQKTWPPAEGIFGFILPKYMSKLHNKLIHYPYKPIRVASFAFKITEKKPIKINNGVYLYRYGN